MADDITPSHVSSAEYISGVQLEMFPFSSVCVFGPRFHCNTFLVSNSKDWLKVNEVLEIWSRSHCVVT